jgi:Flp pilus assembly protein TadB
VTVLGGLAGAVTLAGLLLVLVGLRPAPDRPPAPPRPRRTRLPAASGRSAAAVGAALATLAVTRWPVAAAAAAAAVVAVPALLSGRPAAHRVARLEALAGWTRRLADLLGSGAGGLEQALQASVRTCPAAIAAEVTALVRRLPTSGAEPALRAFADDLDDPAGDLVAAALILRVRHGGRGLRPVLDALAEDIADQVRSRREVEADRARPRANVRTLAAITVLVLAAMLLASRAYLAPFGTAAGQLVLAADAGVFAGGFALMARLTRPTVAGRFLPPSTADRPGRR